MALCRLCPHRKATVVSQDNPENPDPQEKEV